ncbi:OprD family outer membrane porin [Alloalcanivorax marinus]|uniref:OprD family outer membrane porin n=1 Tax=Alloalcanivorax marinus TaxID=1177169 RepID=UPI001933D21A|nr:OprD family outer membrane porin [Alloalcanivorax marinus]MBL7250410.1 OprD family outer membrane porin [Alloalcanivorax marinus]
MDKQKLLFIPVVLLSFQAAHAAVISDIDLYKKENELSTYLRFITFDTRAHNDLIENQLGGLPTGERLGATALSGAVDYSSKYYGDTIGFVTSVYGVTKLDSRPDSRQILDDSDGGNDGFAEAGQAYIKLRQGGENWSADLQAGRGRFHVGTVWTLDTRAVPGSFQGARAQVNTALPSLGPLPAELTFEAGYIDKTSPRERPEFEHIVNESGSTIDNISTYALTYDAKAVRLQVAQGVAKDFNKNTRYELILKAPLGDDMGVVLDNQYYYLESDGALWGEDLANGVAAYDDHAEWLNINLGFKIKKLQLGLSYSKARAELSNGQVGYAYYDHGENVDGRLDVWTRSGNDANNDGETTWQLGVGYDFSGMKLGGLPLDGVSLLALYRQGSFDAPNPINGGAEEEVTERHREVRLSYYFEEKDYKGLSVGVMYVDYSMNKDFVPLVSAQPNSVLSGTDFRVYADYAF